MKYSDLLDIPAFRGYLFGMSTVLETVFLTVIHEKYFPESINRPLLSPKEGKQA